MPEIDFIPLRVRAYLQAPVVCDAYLPIDGILYYHYVRSIFGAKKTGHQPRQSMVRQGAGIQLPIQKRNINQEHKWYYACSFAVFAPTAKRTKINYAKRFDVHEAIERVDFGGKRGRVNTKSGAYKNYFIEEYAWETPYIDWYMRGYQKEIEELLLFCTHIGKETAQGMGSVLRWEVTHTPKQDWYLNDDKGRLMRAIPVDEKRSSFVYGIRPSYWLPHHQFPVLLPT